MTSKLSRAQGCLLGQCVGDALGSLVEFQSSEEILRRYPDGVRELHDGGTWNTLAGQPTDDTEMALALARSIVDQGKYSHEHAFDAYVEWFESKPFDCGNTIASALQGNRVASSQANGALMRISPLGVYGSGKPLAQVATWAQEDARLTHPNSICGQANALFATALSYSIDSNAGAEEVFVHIVDWSQKFQVDSSLAKVIQSSEAEKPSYLPGQEGWVLFAFGNALWQLIHSHGFESGVVDTIMCGGDTDTNAAIAGALLGAVHGLEAVPKRWVNCVLNCRPKGGLADVKRPRPQKYWPIDVLDVAEALLNL